MSDTPLEQHYQPVTIRVNETELMNIFDNLESGLEYMQGELTGHDAALGRTTKKNRSWAETIESDILKTKQSMEILAKTLNKS
jgi:hypothetical protein